MENQSLGIFKFTTITLPDNIYNSFFYLHQADVQSRKDCQIIQLQYGDNFEKKFYTTIGLFISAVPRGCIGATALIAERLGLRNNDEVFVHVCGSKSLRGVTVRPVTAFDYNILLNVHSLMEVIMMDQVRVVAPRQKLPLKVGNIVVDLVIETLNPSGEYGCLEKYTEVEILEPGEQPLDDITKPSNELVPVESISDVVWKIYQWGLRIWDPKYRPPEPAPVKIMPTKETILASFRKRPRDNVEYRVVLEENLLKGADVVYTNVGFSQQPKPCRITKVPEKTALFLTPNDAPKEDVTFTCCLISSRDGVKCLKPEVFLPKRLMSQLNVTVGSRVKIEEIEELPVSSESENVSEENSAEEEEEIFLWPSIQKVYDKVVNLIDRSNALITGPVGCGKTSLLKKIASQCTEQSIFCSKIDCKNLRGKKVENLLKILSVKFSECAHRDPSVLLLDDLDSLMYLPEGDEGDNGMGGSYCKRVATLISDLYATFTKTCEIHVVATSASVASLGPLSSSRGPRLFSLVEKIPEMTLLERQGMMAKLGVPLDDETAEKTHGYRIQDLADLAGRVKLRALVADRGVSEEDIAGALEDTTPMALYGVALQEDIPYRWSDVGGLSEVKNTLDEIFRWPSQYPEVFSSCPLTLQTGVLLYGAPGCGKTLVAGALANECGMNFISVKGPELLSKYVGASEAAVRSLFERAHQAKPCLLFFDEMDSLAPKRGADSTGVTDRVVNQMLTELDGVEGREGVWVVGASSRPDLIDPALLRPGRLDRTVFCPLPTQEERLEILEVLSKKVNLCEDVSLVEVAAKTENFTGADLQALLYNAQMAAIKANQSCESEPPITEADVAHALLSTKPSLTKGDLLKYQKIFARFQVRRGVRDTAPEVMQQKVTFA